MAKKVLLVDDTDTVLMFERMTLRGMGVEILVAKDGREALDRVRDGRPDLILLDIQMPELDGVEVCRQLKEDPATSAIPIVMVTTRGEPASVEASFMAGCNDYLTKPIDKFELMAKVRSYLG